ncbi:MAG: efflux RND transporter periplasmic adaptor subunit [Eubacteriales bacterium]|nr:efflux RND transporter periplasmic adaptor subunit [Eubacteriales bacterium]
MKKKKLAITLLVLVLAAGAGTSVWYFRFRGKAGRISEDENAVFVDNVGVITGLSQDNGRITRFAGVIEPQKTDKVQLASGMKVKETYVSVGQEVSVGTKLFSYDTDEAQDNVTQLEIDIENDEISIESSKSQIETLKKGRDKVSENEKLSYTTQIMTIENSIKRYEYEIKSKQAEMENLKKQIENAVVSSKVEGVIKSINSNGDSGDNDYTSSSSSEDSSAYITIMQLGQYRVKGIVNEQNVRDVYAGENVLIRSRVDSSLIWKGTVSTIDKENASNNQNNSYYMGGGDSMTSSSSYPFYVELEASDDLMLGQHVYIEEDRGQGEEKEGMWLDDYYFIADEEGETTPYVWAADANDRLEKREVTLGSYNDETYQYEILGGLTVDDYIAYPEEDYVEGMTVTRNVDQTGGGDDYDMGDDGEFSGDYDMGDDGEFSGNFEMGDDEGFSGDFEMGDNEGFEDDWGDDSEDGIDTSDDWESDDGEELSMPGDDE